MDPDLLRKTCEAVVNDPAFKKRDVTGDGKDETFCNQAAHAIASDFGCDAFDKKLANEIVKLMKESDEWSPCSSEKACKLAQLGHLVVAAQFNAQGPGHVAVVYPGPMLFSGKWNKKVPMVANVGKTNGIMGVNFAFASEPEYFLYTRIPG